MSDVVLLQGVSRAYETTPPVNALANCDLSIASGDFLTIEGPSGSGKSTLLNVLGLLDRPSSGTFWLNGVNTSEISETQRSALRGQKIGFIFQSFELLKHRPAIDSVKLALMYRGVSSSDQREQALEALEAVGLGHRCNAPANTLSGGERQRVAVARAIVGRPAILLCDEPTGNLDSENAESILRLLEGLNRDHGVTIALITHSAEVARSGSRHLYIRDGVVREMSTGL